MGRSDDHPLPIDKPPAPVEMIVAKNLHRGRLGRLVNGFLGNLLSSSESSRQRQQQCQKNNPFGHTAIGQRRMIHGRDLC